MSIIKSCDRNFHVFLFDIIVYTIICFFKVKIERPKSALFIRRKSDINIHNKIEKKIDHDIDLNENNYDYGIGNNDKCDSNGDRMMHENSRDIIDSDDNFCNYNNINTKNNYNNHNNYNNNYNLKKIHQADINSNEMNKNYNRNHNKKNANDDNDDDMKSILNNIKARALNPAVLF